MELVICGEPSYEQAKASYLTMFRPPILVHPQLAEDMDRAEYLSYLARHGTHYISDL